MTPRYQFGLRSKFKRDEFRRRPNLHPPFPEVDVDSTDNDDHRSFTLLLSIMLARSALGRIASQPAVLGAAPSQARNMATLREIELRLKSVRNIEKITKVCPQTSTHASEWSLNVRAVHENDCLDKTVQGAARYVGW